MQIYKHQIVQELEDFYGDLLLNFASFPSIYHHLHAITQRLWEGVQSQHEAVFSEINNYHPKYLGVAFQGLIEANLTLSDCQETIAHEYGFKNWQEIENLKTTPYHLNFEYAVDYLLAGELELLTALMEAHPELIYQNSQYGHHATLLHYTASNGVELWRQKVPINLVAITQLLLAKGADSRAKMQVYGGAFDTLSLLVSSAHPAQAGVVKDMKALLEAL